MGNEWSPKLTALARSGQVTNESKQLSVDRHERVVPGPFPEQCTQGVGGDPRARWYVYHQERVALRTGEAVRFAGCNQCHAVRRDVALCATDDHAQPTFEWQHYLVKVVTVGDDIATIATYFEQRLQT